MRGILGWATFASTLTLLGCSSVVPSLAPGLHDDAVAYGTAISDINDRVLLSNIIRARDYVPLNITELSTVTGTLTAQTNLGLSVPFGGNYGTTPRGTVTPAVELGAAPTFNMAALNTRGFTLNIIQPISPVYIASKWNSGISHELLLLLFVKEIQFADSYASSPEKCSSLRDTGKGSAALPDSTSAGDPTDTKLVACHHKFLNNPDAPGEEAAFRAVIESVLPTVGIKVMKILEPIGPPFPFLPPAARLNAAAQMSVVDAKGKNDAVSAQFQNPLDAYALTTHLDDGQYHVGDAEKFPGRGQLYRVFANQVAVCAEDPVKTADGTFYIYPVGADIETAKHAQSAREGTVTVPFAKSQEDRLDSFKAQCAASDHPADHACTAAKALTGKPMSTGSVNAFGSYSLTVSAIAGEASPGAANDAASAGGRAAHGSGGSAMPAVSSSLQENRVAAFLRADDCYADQTVRDPTTETEFRKHTETLGHIEWRSVAEVFQYLGAVLRQQNGVTWRVSQDRDVVGSSAENLRDAMFILRRSDSEEGKQARLRIDYDGVHVAVGSGHVASPIGLLNDQSLRVLSILSELVNSAKLSSDIPMTQQLQVLP